LYLENITPEEAYRIAENLRIKIADVPIHFESQSISVTASFGVAVMDASQTDIDNLLRQADQAMYKAKADGRNCVVISTSF